jgi:hypothetical protein
VVSQRWCRWNMQAVDMIVCLKRGFRVERC